MAVGALPGVLWLIHQGFVYWCIHDMEHRSEKWRADFEGWFDCLPEKVLRTVILATLLFAAGKWNELLNLSGSTMSTTEASLVFLRANRTLVLVLLWWDFFALMNEFGRKRQHKGRKREDGSAHPHIIDKAVYAFFLSDLTALLMQISLVNVFYDSDWVIGVVAFLVLYSLAIFYRVYYSLLRPLFKRRQPDVLLLSAPD
jgi:hypothetical protein